MLHRKSKSSLVFIGRFVYTCMGTKFELFLGHTDHVSLTWLIIFEEKFLLVLRKRNSILFKLMNAVYLNSYFDSSGVSGEIPSTFANLQSLTTV